MRKGALLWALPWAMALGLFAQVAPAQPSGDAKRAARELADKGYEQYQAGDYEKAIQSFREAEARFHAPTLIVMQANAHEKRRELIQARDLYSRVVNETLAPDAPQEFIDAQNEAKKILETVAVRISTLKIILKGTAAENVRVTIDDVEIPKEKLLLPIEQNPGIHKVMASIGAEEEGRAVFQQVDLKEGSVKQIQLVFRPGEPKNVTPPSGGCASCEVALRRNEQERDAPALFTAATALAISQLRRRRKS